jgi:Cu/Ag efflux pump CusA
MDRGMLRGSDGEMENYRHQSCRADHRRRDFRQQSVADIVVDASRHIVSTTLTTIGGFIPLIVNGGKFWPPLATAIAGGVAGSAIIALYFIPASYAAIQRKQQRKLAAKQAKVAAKPNYA